MGSALVHLPNHVAQYRTPWRWSPVSSSRSIPVYLYRFSETVVSAGACQLVAPYGKYSS